ncbi:hypothetical protein GCM10011351_21860 [Paraliobacillus quinghaiensis]|uniref:Glycoside hydrolase family 3 N-terminal domain-containing protein n=1 Tax=Paraliobacillus quinghaiensis TaxID=470815 RepID=A0A917TSH6_9BACI|nr:glycoside hydrolase family 3 N-terminal domain-containing protein [Paraliobacillus quinghaiensis]GGM35411.1 hypothetical protein GCM10011351_21860 [Paraliobacillus quinghaiensis]
MIGEEVESLGINMNRLLQTDALNMEVISAHFGPVDAVIRSVKAGTDIVLMPVGLPEVADGLLDAVKIGQNSDN